MFDDEEDDEFFWDEDDFYDPEDDYLDLDFDFDRHFEDDD